MYYKDKRVHTQTQVKKYRKTSQIWKASGTRTVILPVSYLELLLLSVDISALFSPLQISFLGISPLVFTWPVSLTTNRGSKKHPRDSNPNSQNGDSDPAIVRCLISCGQGKEY